MSKVDDFLKERGIPHRRLSKAEVSEHCHRFMAFRFRRGPFAMDNFKASDEHLRTGGRVIRSYPLVDIDEVNLPDTVSPCGRMDVNGYGIATDLLSFLTSSEAALCLFFKEHLKASEDTPPKTYYTDRRGLPCASTSRGRRAGSS